MSGKARKTPRRAGLRPGDVILSLDGEEVRSVEAFRRRIGASSGATVALRVQRGAVRLYMALRVSG